MTWACCRESGHLIFPPEEPRKPVCCGWGTDGLVGISEWVGGGTEALGCHNITHPHTHTKKKIKEGGKGDWKKLKVFLLCQR